MLGSGCGNSSTCLLSFFNDAITLCWDLIIGCPKYRDGTQCTLKKGRREGEVGRGEEGWGTLPYFCMPDPLKMHRYLTEPLDPCYKV